MSDVITLTTNVVATYDVDVRFLRDIFNQLHTLAREHASAIEIFSEIKISTSLSAEVRRTRSFWNCNVPDEYIAPSAVAVEISIWGRHRSGCDFSLGMSLDTERGDNLHARGEQPLARAAFEAMQNALLSRKRTDIPAPQPGNSYVTATLLGLGAMAALVASFLDSKARFLVGSVSTVTFLSWILLVTKRNRSRKGSGQQQSSIILPAYDPQQARSSRNAIKHIEEMGKKKCDLASKPTAPYLSTIENQEF